MKVHIALVIVFVAFAFAGGWFVSQNISARTVTQQPQSQPDTSGANISETPSVDIDIYSGTGMTSSELYTTLNELSGVDFDKRYINYVILLQSDLTGINRLAKEKAVAPDLKQRATELWGVDDQRLRDLFTLQKQLGYSHH